MNCVDWAALATATLGPVSVVLLAWFAVLKSRKLGPAIFDTQKQVTEVNHAVNGKPDGEPSISQEVTDIRETLAPDVTGSDYYPRPPLQEKPPER